MSECTILEDLKVLESDLDAREDIKQALEALKAKFNSSNGSNSTSSRCGFKIKPAKPKFHGNFPKQIFLDVPGPSSSGSVAQYEDAIVASNLNCYPVFDAKLFKYTNGCVNNAAFNLTVDETYGQATVAGWDSNTYTFLFKRDLPLIDSVLEEYTADPSNDKWQKWKRLSGGVLIGNEYDFEYVDEPGNPIVWEPFNPDDFEHVTDTIVAVKVDCDPQSGFYSIFVEVTDGEPLAEYSIPMIATIKNGNGESSLSLPLILKMIDLIDPPGGPVTPPLLDEY